jgi:hypothetical protein
VANLGVNYKDAGRLKEAVALLEEAHRAVKKHPKLAWVTPQLIDAYQKAGENGKVATLLLEQLPAARKALPKGSPQLGGLLAQVGLGLLELKLWAEAEPLHRDGQAGRGEGSKMAITASSRGRRRDGRSSRTGRWSWKR